MTARFAEYREISISEPMRQGDVLEAVDPEASCWQRHLLVITADCDFANNKNHGRVTCVPLLTKAEYHAQFQIPKLRERMVRKPLDELTKIIANSPTPNISEMRLRAWASEQEAAAIVTLLGLDGSSEKLAIQCIDAIRLLDSVAGDLQAGVAALVEAQLRGPNPPKEANARKQVLDPLKSAYAQPPGDALFLSAIGPGMDDGYFVYLRHLEQVWEPSIATGPSRRESTYKRIARLHDRFTHAVAQRFAMVFMSIGLPREYEDLRDLHSEMLGDELQ